MKAFLLGVDGGGTQTRAVLAEPDGRILGFGQSGSSNLYNLGIDRAMHHILAAIDAALESSGVRRDAVTSFGFGLAGVVGDGEKMRLKNALAPLLGQNLWIEEDVVAALVGAFGPQELRKGGAILIAGTGANCLGQSPGGARARTDGWGPVLGDRGSAFWLGEAGIRSAVAAIDGAAPATVLGAALLEFFGVQDLSALVGVIYARDFERQRIAAFSQVVAQKAESGDAVAADLLTRCGVLLAQTARGVLERLGVQKLSIAGGLLENNARVRQSLAHTLGEGVSLCTPRFSPAVGAALLPLSEF